MAVLMIPINAQARIKLAAVPERAATIVRLDNPQYTLIEEERTLTLQKGLNKVDFAWNGVTIDPDSIRVEFLSHPNEVKLLNLNYPPNESALVWEISSVDAWEEKIRVSYLLSQIDRLVTYKILANQDETQADLKSFLIIRNFSGEDFVKAQLVLDYGQSYEQGIQHEETKQLAFFESPAMPIKKIWKWDSQLQAWDPQQQRDNVGIPVTYRLANKTESGMGKKALWGGKVRVYQKDRQDSEILLGEDEAVLTPVGEDMAVYIGDSRDLVVTQRKMVDQRINLRKNTWSQIVLFDNEEILETKIENFKDSPAVLTLVEHIADEWEMKNSNLPFTFKDANTIEYEIELAPRSTKDLKLHYIRKNLRQ
jgi:hypothetical protein